MPQDNIQGRDNAHCTPLMSLTREKERTREREKETENNKKKAKKK